MNNPHSPPPAPAPRPPRDWLLARHAGATPSLDARRAAALPPADLSWADLLRALFVPHRRVWYTLAGAWLVLVALHYLPARPAVTPRPTVELPPQLIAALLRPTSLDETLAQIDRHP